MEISSAIPDLNFGIDQEIEDDDGVYLGNGKNRIARVSYDREKNNGDLSSMDIYRPFLDDEDEDDEDEDRMPYDSERRQNKLDRYVSSIPDCEFRCISRFQRCGRFGQR